MNPLDLHAVRIVHDERVEQMKRAAGQSRQHKHQPGRRQPQFRRRQMYS